MMKIMKQVVIIFDKSFLISYDFFQFSKNFF